jgi:acyl-CoA synthetase (AMP-forming)/AMP-acid ligase II
MIALDRTGTTSEQGRDIASRVRQMAADQPEKIFCRVLTGKRSQAITYGELLDVSNRFAAAYLDHGVRPGDVVLIILRHGPDLFSSFLGALLIGALPSFLPFLTAKQQPELYWNVHRALFSGIDVRLLVTWGDNLASMRHSIPDLSLPVHLAENTPRGGETPRIPQRDFRGPAFLQHSSGTTGLKKGVVIVHEALAAQVSAYAEAIGLSGRDTIATWLPVYHDMGLIACFLMPLMLGVPVVALDPFEWVTRPTMLLDVIEKYRCTLAWMPNFAFHHICGLAPTGKRWDLSCVRALINCSEPCKPDTFRLFAERFGGMGAGMEKLQTCYGLAENVFCATQSPLGKAVAVLQADRRVFQDEKRVEVAAAGRDSISFLGCGSPVAGVQVRIVDPDGHAAPEGHLGEVALSGASLFDGYYLNPAATRASRSGEWYRTRDLGFWRDGTLFLAGRMDDLLIVHGVNYYAHDIEFAVNRVPGLIPGRCVAVGEYQPGAGTTEVTVLAEAGECSSDGVPHLRRAIKRKVLAETGLLVQEVGIVPKGWLIKTTSGKVSRVENIRQYRQIGGVRNDRS